LLKNPLTTSATPRAMKDSTRFALTVLQLGNRPDGQWTVEAIWDRITELMRFELAALVAISIY
jgi:hypothetical protein